MGRDPYELATEYLGLFALECHFTPQQVYDMGWFPLIKLTFTLDAIVDERKEAKAKADAEAARQGRS